MRQQECSGSGCKILTQAEIRRFKKEFKDDKRFIYVFFCLNKCKFRHECKFYQDNNAAKPFKTALLWLRGWK